MRRRGVLIGLAGAALARPGRVRAAAGMPDLTVVCPWPEDSDDSALARVLASALTTVGGRPATAINVDGGSGAVGFSAIMRAPPDGSVVGVISFELNALSAYGVVPFDWRDFDPILRFSVDAAAVSVRADSAFATLADLIAAAKTAPGTLTVANAGPETVWQVGAALMVDRLGMGIRHEPKAGSAEAVAATADGSVDAVVSSLAEAREQVKAGHLKPLAVMSEARAPAFPLVPTFTELGCPLVFGAWRGVALPKGVPSAIRVPLVDDIKRAVQSPAFVDFVNTNGHVFAYQEGADFRAFLARNAAEVRRIIASIDLRRH